MMHTHSSAAEKAAHDAVFEPRLDISHIFCPVDQSETSRHALAHARALARWHVAELFVIEVVWRGLPPTIPAPFGTETSWPVIPDEDVAKGLDAFCGQVPDGLSERHEICDGPIVPAILERVRNAPAPMIVMGTNGRSGFERALLGSVSERVLHKASCPVVVVPPDAKTTGAPYRRILCATDFSAASTQALRYALSLSQEANSILFVQHVADPGSDSEATTACAYTDTLSRANAARLERLVPARARDWCDVRTIVSRGRPHEEIVKTAAVEEADLIVMGVHSRPALLAAFLGSTTNQVVRHAPCPVLVARP